MRTSHPSLQPFRVSPPCPALPLPSPFSLPGLSGWEEMTGLLWNLAATVSFSLLFGSIFKTVSAGGCWGGGKVLLKGQRQSGLSPRASSYFGSLLTHQGLWEEPSLPLRSRSGLPPGPISCLSFAALDLTTRLCNLKEWVALKTDLLLLYF